MTVAADLPIGVVGVGSLGYHHARLLRELPGAALVGIHDIDSRRAQEVSERVAVRVFRELDALLQQVEAVVIAVPTLQHAPVALRAIERGVHVLIEKPLAPSLAAADSILEAASARGTVVATGHVERFNRVLRACEPYLEDPRFIESHRLAPFVPRGTDVAVVLDLMIHDIDLVLGLVGESVSALDAVGIPVLTPTVDIVNARLRFAGGAVANITASRVSKERMRKIRIFQESGYLSLDLAGSVGEYLRLREGAVLSTPEALTQGLEGLVERVELAGDGVEPLRVQLESFLQAVRGDAALVVSGEEGRHALEVALQIVEHIEHVPDPHPA